MTSPCRSQPAPTNLMHQQVLAALIGLVHLEHVLRVVELELLVAELAEVRVAVRVVHGAGGGRTLPAAAAAARHQGVIRVVSLAAEANLCCAIGKSREMVTRKISAGMAADSPSSWVCASQTGVSTDGTMLMIEWKIMDEVLGIRI